MLSTLFNRHVTIVEIISIAYFESKPRHTVYMQFKNEQATSRLSAYN